MIILKYTLQVDSFQEIDIPKSGKIISLQVQHNMPVIWVQCVGNGKEQKTKRKFITLTTGLEHVNNETLYYIGTYQLNNGNFVGHLYEIK